MEVFADVLGCSVAAGLGAATAVGAGDRVGAVVVAAGGFATGTAGVVRDDGVAETADGLAAGPNCIQAKYPAAAITTTAATAINIFLLPGLAARVLPMANAGTDEEDVSSAEAGASPAEVVTSEVVTAVASGSATTSEGFSGAATFVFTSRAGAGALAAPVEVKLGDVKLEALALRGRTESVPESALALTDFFDSPNSTAGAAACTAKLGFSVGLESIFLGSVFFDSIFFGSIMLELIGAWIWGSVFDAIFSCAVGWGAASGAGFVS